MRTKEFRFPTTVIWDGGRRATAAVAGKPPLAIATPPEFKGSDPGLWSPEDAFTAAVGSCLAVTVSALAERGQVPLHALAVDATGIVGRRLDGRFGFVRIEQAVRAETDDQHVDALRELVARADETCLVAVSLDVPVETKVDVRARVTV